MLEIHDYLVSSSDPREIPRELFKYHFEGASNILPFPCVPEMGMLSQRLVRIVSDTPGMHSREYHPHSFEAD